MERFDAEDQVSITIDDHEYEYDGEIGSESDEYDDSSSCNEFVKKSGMFRLGEKGLEYEIVAKSFLSGLGSLNTEAEVVGVHKNWVSDLDSDSEKKARLESFRIFSEAVGNKCGGDANIRYGWYGGSRDEISEILCYGFSKCNNNNNKEQQHGVGVYLSAGRFSIDCVSSSEVDEKGLRHMLLCRVILGRLEQISSGSTQFHPSSYQFDTGVDNVFIPRKYIVWPAFMNSHIQPIYVVTFKAPKPNDIQIQSANVPKPTSPWLSFPTLISVLSRFLDRTKMGLIHKCHNDFKRNKIPRPQLINKVRNIAGDELLIAVINKYKRNEVMQLA